MTRVYDRRDVQWCVLATDGAQRGIDHSGITWEDLPHADDDDLRAMLDRLHQWESETDPAGILAPSATTTRPSSPGPPSDPPPPAAAVFRPSPVQGGALSGAARRSVLCSRKRRPTA